MTSLGTLTKRSHWTIRTAILFHQHISCKVWSIIATSATLWWSVRHTEIQKISNLHEIWIFKCSWAPSSDSFLKKVDHGYNDMRGGYWRRNVLVTTFGCWWPIYTSKKSPKYVMERIVYDLVTNTWNISPS